MDRFFRTHTTTVVEAAPTVKLDHDVGFRPDLRRAEFSGLEATTRQVVYLWDRGRFHGRHREYAVGESRVYTVVCTRYPFSSPGLFPEKGDMILWIVGKADTRGSARFISRNCLRRPGLKFTGKPSSRTPAGASRTARLLGSSKMPRLLGGPFSCVVWYFCQPGSSCDDFVAG